MGIVRRGPLTRGVLLVVLVLVALLGVVEPGFAVGGVELLPNGGFEQGGGSLAGWVAVSGKLSLASDGYGGGHAALAGVPGKGAKSPISYGLTTSAPVVTGVPAGESFTAGGRVRTAATTGKPVCLVLRELTPGGSLVRATQQCALPTTTWTSLPTTTATITKGGDSLALTVQQSNGVGGNSFEADSLTLVDPDTTAPTQPTGLTAVAPSSTEVDLSWQASSDADGAGVTGYVVRRDGATIATVAGTATSYRDTSVAGSTSYSYTVTAFDFSKNTSSPSDAATVTTPAPPVDDPPTVPGNLAATAASSSEVDLSWTASTDTDATGVAGYVVSRDGTQVGTVSAPATSFKDTSVTGATTYSYTVAAFDSASNSSGPSAPVSVTTPAASSGVVDDLWRMDETSGTTMVDSGQTPHPGLLHDVALGRPGDPAFPGTSYGFNGTSSSVDVGTSDDLNAGSRDVRIGLSLNTTTVPAVPDYDLFRKGQYPGTEYKLELQPNGQFSCEFRTLQADGTVKGYTIQPAIDLHDGKWHRLTCTKVGGTMTVTIDGAAFTKSITGSISNGYHLMIGAYSPSGGDLYQGLLDQVSFHIG